jgi:hypothetical protein
LVIGTIAAVAKERETILPDSPRVKPTLPKLELLERDDRPPDYVTA